MYIDYYWHVQTPQAVVAAVVLLTIAAVIDLQYVTIAEHPFVALSDDLSAKRSKGQYIHSQNSTYVGISAGSCVYL